MSGKEYSKTFCPYPWIHVMTQPTGTVSWCCVARDNFKNDDGSMVDLNKGDRIESVWNNDHMRKIRKQMIEGEAVNGCNHCYDLEDMGFPSYRTNYIRDWFEYSGRGEEIHNIIEKSINNDYYVEEAPMYLDFRLGNMCNLKCRMCQPQNSSQINKEYVKIEQADPESAQFIKDNFTWGQFAENITPWQDDPDNSTKISRSSRLCRPSGQKVTRRPRWRTSWRRRACTKAACTRRSATSIHCS